MSALRDLRPNNRNLTHGMTESREYQAWCNMKSRCSATQGENYANYKARGITVCDRWKNSFEAFFSDMGLLPGPGYSLERVNNSLGYSKSNCIWATMYTQSRNKRVNRLLTYDGRTQCLQDWANELHIDVTTILKRLNNGWATPEALTTPILPTRRMQARNRHNNVLLTYAGRTQCLSAWAEEKHIGISTLHKRLQKGLSIEEVLCTPVQPLHMLTYAGKTQCLQDWANELHITRSMLKNRLRRGWSVEDALCTPARPRKR